MHSDRSPTFQLTLEVVPKEMWKNDLPKLEWLLTHSIYIFPAGQDEALRWIHHVTVLCNQGTPSLCFMQYFSSLGMSLGAFSA